MTAALLLAILFKPASLWQINENHALIWDQKPYLPVGLNIDGAVSEIEKASADGIKDVVVSLSSDGRNWKDVFSALEDRGMRYFVSIDSLPPMRENVVVDPAGYRIPEISRKTTVTLDFPGAKEVLLVLVAQRDSTIRWSKRVPVIDGQIQQTIDPLVDIPHVLLAYPLQVSAEVTDYYDGLDEHRDKVLAAFQGSKPGSGYRGLMNPFGFGARFVDENTTCIPTSKLYQAELANFLEIKYSGVSTALHAWGFSTNDVSTFADLARLIPLWSDTRGVGALWDIETDKITTVDRKTSLAWRDIHEAMRIVAGRRAKNLIENIKATTQGPVFAAWSGWSGPYQEPNPIINGVITTPNSRSMSSIISDAAFPISTILRSSASMVAMSTHVELRTTSPDIGNIVSELEGLGYRGWYFRTSDPAKRKQIAKLAQEHVADTSSSEWKVQGLFYPEAASDPAAPTRLRGGIWWLPAPIKGTRLNIGSGIDGYQAENETILWSTDEPKKVSFMIPVADNLSVTTLEGQAVEFKRKKKEREVELLLPTSPIIFKGIDTTPVPTSAVIETTNALTVMLDTMDNVVNTGGGEKYQFADTVKSLERDPGIAFKTLRAQLYRIAPKAAPYVWIAASRSTNHNFGNVGPAVGSAYDNVLLLSNRFMPNQGFFFADYPLQPRVPGSHEVWLAARIPEFARDKIRVLAGDRLLGPPSNPVSFYGDGFAWYKFGDIELQKGITNFRVELPQLTNSGIALDIICLANPGFRPQGPRQPLEWLKNMKPATKGKDSGGQ